MKIEVKIGDITKEDCDILIVSIFEGAKTPDDAIGVIDKILNKSISLEIKKTKFERKEGEILLIFSEGKIRAKKVLIVGLGKKENFSTETIRRVIGFSLKRARLEKAKKVATILHGGDVGGIKPSDAGQAITEAALLSSYQFLKYKSKGEIEKLKNNQIERLVIVEKDSLKRKEILEGVKLGKIFSEAVIYTRDLVNEPSEEVKPKRLAEEAKKIAKKAKQISCRIFDEKGIRKMKMGGILGVSQGSDDPPYFVHLTFHPKEIKSKEKIFIVGKGITFDSGGLSLKPTEAMQTMKMDMAGAASVLGIFLVLSKLNIKTEVHGVFGACENLPSGRALKVGDILRAMNGKTIEVLNTDAEGRLTLADALSYAIKEKATSIIDLATLTGACIVALGDDICGLFSNNLKLKSDFLSASQLSGEKFWELPLEKSYREHLQSKVADIKNIGKARSAGAIAGALFLQEFVNKTPWIHLDIAGPAWQEMDNHPYIPFGGTGFGIRTLLHYLINKS